MTASASLDRHLWDFRCGNPHVETLVDGCERDKNSKDQRLEQGRHDICNAHNTEQILEIILKLNGIYKLGDHVRSEQPEEVEIDRQQDR